MNAGDVVATVMGPDSRVAVLREATWDHVLVAHPEMVDRLSDVVATIERPELRENDPRPGRSRSFRRCGPERWLRVVVEFRGERDAIVTAFPQANDPEGWQR